MTELASRACKNWTGNEVEHERLYSTLLLADVGRDVFERLAVGEARRSTEGEGGELVRQVLRDEVFAFLHQLAELLEALESTHTRPFICGIDGRTVGEFGTSTGPRLNEGAVIIPPATDDVEALQPRSRAGRSCGDTNCNWRCRDASRAAL